MMTKKMKAVFTIIPSEHVKRPLYRRIGTAFVNADASLHVVLDCLPMTGRLVIRDIDLEPPAGEACR